MVVKIRSCAGAVATRSWRHTHGDALTKVDGPVLGVRGRGDSRLYIALAGSGWKQFMINRWRAVVLLLVCSVTAYARAQAGPELEPQGQKGTQASAQECVRYEFDPQMLLEQKSSRLEFDAFEGQQGKTIRAIRYESRDIFDETIPEENNWLFRSLNRLHINTREDVIATQLLVTEGEP